MLAVMKASLGTRPMTYANMAMFWCLCQLPLNLDEAAGRAKIHGILGFEACGLLLFSITTCLVAGPLSGELLIWLMTKFPHWSGWKERAWVVTCSLFAITLGLILTSIIRYDALLNKIETSNNDPFENPVTGLFIFYNVSLLVAGAAVCHWERRQKQVLVYKAKVMGYNHRRRKRRTSQLAAT